MLTRSSWKVGGLRKSAMGLLELVNGCCAMLGSAFVSKLWIVVFSFRNRYTVASRLLPHSHDVHVIFSFINSS